MFQCGVRCQHRVESRFLSTEELCLVFRHRRVRILAVSLEAEYRAVRAAGYSLILPQRNSSEQAGHVWDGLNILRKFELDLLTVSTADVEMVVVK
jgi:hypothetical protein